LSSVYVNPHLGSFGVPLIKTMTGHELRIDFILGCQIDFYFSNYSLLSRDCSAKESKTKLTSLPSIFFNIFLSV
jgi:hypothetical protein